MSIDLRPVYQNFFNWLAKLDEVERQVLLKDRRPHCRFCGGEGTLQKDVGDQGICFLCLAQFHQWPLCRYCGRRLPEKPRRQKDRSCIFCLAELNSLPEIEEPEMERIGVGIDKYQPPNSPSKTRFLEDEKTELPGCRKDSFDGQSRIEDGGGWFIAYGDTR